MVPIILDVNLGDNVDDAFALALAAASPEIRLLGVTTSYRHDDPVTLATRQVLAAFGKAEVPVVGRFRQESPIRKTSYRLRIGQAAQSYHGPVARLASQDSVEWIAEQVTRSNRVTLVTVAPLTNVAEAMRRYPRIGPRIREIVVMGGWPTQALPEWNVMSDPDAVLTVLQSRVPVRLVGYEATLSCALSEHHVELLRASREPGPRLLAHFLKLWSYEQFAPAIMHDPLTVALTYQPTLGRFVKERVNVLMDEGPGRGALYLDPTGGHLVDLCINVNSARFLEMLVSRLSPDSVIPALSHNPASWSIAFEAAYRNSYYRGWSVTGVKNHSHVLILTLRGTCRVWLDGEEFQVKPESVIYIPYGKKHSISSHQDLEVIWIQFKAMDNEEGILDYVPDLAPVIYPGDRFSLLLERAEQMLAHWQGSWIEGVLRCHANLLHLLVDLLECVHEVDREPQHHRSSAVAKAKRYIETHLQDKVDLDTLSRHVGISKYYLVRMFRETYGMSPLKYHTLLRMRRAKTLLKLPHLPIADVAEQVGYSSISTFSRAFRQVVGMSPSQFRERA